MTERLREIEQRWNPDLPATDGGFLGVTHMQTRAALRYSQACSDIPYLLGVIKEQQFKLKHMELNHNVEMMKLQRELNHAHFRELSSNGEHSETYEAAERAEDKVWGYGFTGTVILGDDGEHSEDAKPLDGTVQE